MRVRAASTALKIALESVLDKVGQRASLARGALFDRYEQIFLDNSANFTFHNVMAYGLFEIPPPRRGGYGVTRRVPRIEIRGCSLFAALCLLHT